MKESFPYPLPEYALGEFCSPVAGSVFDAPARVGSEIVAANGFLAIRAHRGGWIDSEFAEARPEFVTRFGKLPWGRWDGLGDDWRTLDRQTMMRRGEIGLWLKGKPAPSPVWRVGNVQVRLSMLQLIARLPRAEVQWTGDRDTPLFFRFSGGRGMVARDERLALWSYALFQPTVDPLTGDVVKSASGAKPNFGTPPPPEPALDDWPPVDATKEMFEI